MAMKHRVRFEIAGSPVVGELYTPPGSGPHRAVVVAGPMTSVKEQVTGVYACALAARGFAALSIDHRHYGESGGTPRHYERWQHKVEDLRGALTWLAGRPDIDGDRLGLVGVCLGAGYAAWASLGDPRVRALGLIAGYYRDVEEMKARDPEDFAAKVAAGAAARARYEEHGELVCIPAAALEGDAAMTLAETYDYYATPRAGVPNYENRFAVMSREHFLAFDVQAAAARLTAPLAMVHSERALSPSWARRFFTAAPVEKSVDWVESAGQVAFYDTPELVERASDLVALHLARHLGSGAAGSARAGEPAAGPGQEAGGHVASAARS
jgi:alpha-beta hydrolase superfamily lysophospholipase